MNIYHLYEKNIYHLDEEGNEIILCEVIEFDDGQVVVKWSGKVRSLVIHKNLDEFKSISVNKDRELYRTN